MKTLAVTLALTFAANAAIAADLDADQRRALDDQVIHGRHGYARGYVEAPTPYFAAPPVYYKKKVTTRTCIDDGDGITCHYDRYSAQ